MRRIALFLLLPLLWQAQAQRRMPLSIDTIMRGPNFYGFEPQDLRWSGDGNRLYFQWKQASDNPEGPRDTYMLYRDRGVPIKLSEVESRLAPPANSERTRDRKRSVYARDGEALPPSQTLGRVVECNNFQDAAAFLEPAAAQRLCADYTQRKLFCQVKKPEEFVPPFGVFWR